jgi:DNA-binding NtrC family response regulator
MGDKEYKTVIGVDSSTFAGVATHDAGDRADTLPVFVLKVVDGPDSGALFPLDWTQTSRALVGTSQGCEVKVLDPKVSRRHFALGPHGSYLRLTDLSSTNGTRVNSLRTLEALLRGGETIAVGDTTLKLMRMGDALNPMQHTGEAFGRVLGRSADMQRAFVIGSRLAKTNLPILLEGETGTGKELFAEALHDNSDRREAAFLTLSGLSTPAELDQLLADDGVFAQAQGGSLVIDEVAELSLPAQGRLLTLVERFPAVRTITTTKRDLDREGEAGRLKEDLLFRLAGARIELPPLRRRHGDIALLAAHFWAIAAGTPRTHPGAAPEPSSGHSSAPSAALLAQLHDYHWPGNVREFRHAIDRAVALGDDALLTRKVALAQATPMLTPAPNTAAASASSPDLVDKLLAMDLSLQQARALLVGDFEQRYVEVALARHGGNITRAAAASGLTRRYFHMLRAKQK